jgi:HEPN domain-containing protein
MTTNEQVKYWIEIAEEDLRVAVHLLESGYYSWCLFIGHLVLEKILKAIYVNDNEETPPKIHDLLRLAKSTKITLNPEQEEFLFKVNKFNIEARYPEIKRDFYKVCTKDYATINFLKIKELFEWMKRQIQ